MKTLEIKNKFDALLKQLSVERSFDVAEKITAGLVGLLNIKVTDRFLINLPRVDAELTRFQLAPGFARQAAAYELPHEDGKPIDFKLFWTKKASKTNLSWLIGLTPNFEDALSNDYKNMGIDFVVPETCDSVIVLLSNRFKIRALELKDHITPTQLEIFAQWAKLSDLAIADQNELKSTLHAKLWESFNFEPINRKFYFELVEHFSILVHHLEKDLGRKPSVMFTTRLIGRLLFIWFLKKKNLVNTNVDYFSVPDPEKQAEYYKSQLEKLFFEVLNRNELERNNGDKLTPYLNGGLFDKSTTDFCDDPKLTFPNGYFNKLFDTLNKYNFTVDESSPEFQHVAIDPEMLGRIFESLLAEQIDENTGNSKKKATGAFYTPREIVSYMCEQSLIEYLKTKVPETPDRDRRIDELVRMPEAIFRDQDQNKRRDWKPYREAIIKALEGSKTESPLTVLDPAVGSGAFPMGMLHLLVKVYSRLDPKFEKDISGLKRDILSRSLYGVDIEQTAIEITRLRAWLSIIVDIPEDEKVQPLPNLEFKFVCANTLIPLDSSEQATFFTDHDLKDKLITIRDDYFRTSSKAKKEKLQKDYLKLTEGASLFDNKKTQQLKSYKPFDISSSSEFYDPGLMHGLQAFDVVIGNPPYIGEKGHKKIFQEVKKSILGKYYLGKMDYFYFFFHAALNFLRDNGVNAFITTNYYITATGAVKLRNDLNERSVVLNLINFNELKVFPNAAGQHNLITILQKSKLEIDARTCITNEKGYLGSEILDEIIQGNNKKTNYYVISQSKLFSNGNMVLTTGGLDSILDKIKLSGIELGVITKVTCGIHAGADKVSQKIFDQFPSKEYKIGDGIFVLQNNIELENFRGKDYVKKFHKSSNIKRYATESGDVLHVLYSSPHNKIIDNIFNDHINKYKNILLNIRKINNENLNSWMYLRRGILDQAVYTKEKLVTPYRTNGCRFAYSDEDFYSSLDVYYIVQPKEGYSLKYLLGILNSNLVYVWLYNRGKRKGEMLEIYQEPLSHIPIPQITSKKASDVRQIEKFVDQILNLKKQNKDADTKNLESQIDQLVYKLYDLTPEEIQIVESSSKK